MKFKKAFVLIMVALLLFAGAANVPVAEDEQAVEAVDMINSVEDEGMLTKAWYYDDKSTYVRPSLPTDFALTEVCSVSYDASSIDWMFVDYSTDISALEYGFTTRNYGDRAVYVCTVGGNYVSGIGYWTPAKNVRSASGCMAFADFRGLNDGRSPKFGLTLSTSATGTESDEGALTKHKTVDGVVCYYYDYDGEWRPVVISGGFVTLPDSFVGYVYFPISTFGGLDTTKDNYLQFVRLHFRTFDRYECASSIISDDLVFVKEGAAHTHSYEYVKTVSPICVDEGYDLYRCACGQTKKVNLTPKSAHTLGESVSLGSGSGAVCSFCKRLIRSEQPSDNVGVAAEVTFNYGEPVNDSYTLSFPIGYKLTRFDVPWVYKSEVENEYGLIDTYQMFAFHTDTTYQYPVNPVGYTVTGDTAFYASFNICSYDREHYGHMFKQVAQHGGPYCTDKFQGKTLFFGNSNFMLWWNMEVWYEQRGVSVVNNAVAGSTSYDMLHFVEELVLIYHPKLVVFGISSNDYAYHQMPDRMIMAHAVEYMDRIRAVIPEVQFIVISANPLPGRPEYFSAVRRINDKVEALCETLDYATYVDTEELVFSYCESYPVGWTSWTHMDESVLSVVLGENVIGTIRSLLGQN